MNLNDALKRYQSVFMVYDRNVEELAGRLAAGAGIRACMGIDAREDTKTPGIVTDICRFLLESGADRDAFLLAVGGGTTSDIAGFAAACYKRGIQWGIVSTTLLGMVDASIGGKTGVNLDGFKNMMGAFHMPEFSIPCYEALGTLPDKEFRSGAAEMLKTFLIGGGDLYARAVESLSGTREDLPELIDAAAAIKRGIVEDDPFEKGVRRKLNLGHTFAHAIEWWQRTTGCEEPYSHGEAVAIGIVQAAELSDEALARRLREDFARCGLPTELPCSIDELMPAMEKDKKNDGGGIRFVLINGIGDIVI